MNGQRPSITPRPGARTTFPINHYAAFARYHQTKHNNSLRSEPEGELLASLHNSNSIFQNYQQQPPSEPLPSHRNFLFPASLIFTLESANGGDSLRQLKLRPAPESAKCQLEKTPGSLDSSSSSHLVSRLPSLYPLSSPSFL